MTPHGVTVHSSIFGVIFRVGRYGGQTALLEEVGPHGHPIGSVACVIDDSGGRLAPLGRSALSPAGSMGGNCVVAWVPAEPVRDVEASSPPDDRFKIPINKESIFDPIARQRSMSAPGKEASNALLEAGPPRAWPVTDGATVGCSALGVFDQAVADSDTGEGSIAAKDGPLPPGGDGIALFALVARPLLPCSGCKVSTELS